MARRDILNGAKIREIKKRKKKILYVKIYLVIFVLAAMFTGLIFLSRSEKILIDNINISGNGAVATDDIMKLTSQELLGNYFFVFPKRNIFIYPKIRIERSILENFKRISDVKIKINNLKEITVFVTEREGKYLWCDSSASDQERCYFADRSGYIFDQAPNFSGNSYFKFFGGIKAGKEPIGSYILSVEEFERFLSFYDGVIIVTSPIKLIALEINENGDYKFSMEKTDGKIIFKRNNDFEKILENLDSAIDSEPLKIDLAKKLESLIYIDLRFDNKVYFKFQ